MTARQGLRERNRQAARELVLDAAERLLQAGDAGDFSMRRLAAEAGVGFATPFNHFGSKTAIMQALSSRLIARMADRFAAAPRQGDALDRVLTMGELACALLLEKPEIHKAVVGSLGTAGPAPSAVRAHSERLWVLALGDHAGMAPERLLLAREMLAGQLAYGFRGCVSFWIAGELGGERLAASFAGLAASIMLGFARPDRQADLLAHIEAAGARA
jgi:AcrR family transcriptional regulator